MSLEVTVARIDENVKHIKETLPPILQTQKEHSIDIANIKRDRKWFIALVVALSGIVGTVATIVAEMYRS